MTQLLWKSQCMFLLASRTHLIDWTDHLSLIFLRVCWVKEMTTLEMVTLMKGMSLHLLMLGERRKKLPMILTSWEFLSKTMDPALLCQGMVLTDPTMIIMQITSHSTTWTMLTVDLDTATSTIMTKEVLAKTETVWLVWDGMKRQSSSWKRKISHPPQNARF